MKPCALCRNPALLFCESDRASLCWDCDAKVHGANFLVTRHTRCLLCRACQEPTPWKASGSQLGRTVSVCEACANGNCDSAAKETPAASARGVESGRMAAVTAPEVSEERGLHSSEEDDDDQMGTDFDEEISTDYDDDEEEEEDEDDSDDEDEDGENQVVPWSIAAAEDAAAEPPPPPPSGSSSSSDDADYFSYDYDSFSSRRDGATRTRMMMMMMMQADDDEEDTSFDGAAGGFTKRKMLPRGNAAADLAPSYPYQVC